ncbi:outer membrane lipoprotein chaperone LolA [Paracidovorax valerianellae]|uniref:Outer-membrane lipoprotein carrier protein n=1 Tax=Paracidovorax valerianellae TaxID=187868 RepID=A0A1G6MLL9_9BURK|nr:outer membrane lipoprotein chaperone LolA [Paracidovorax valerianellae]MDA8443984.1 outer membrane lipoprotein chaperone LolA [Paracidovorax valerianellae]SDC56371.1 outer membrane lipoprotein carrier protein [Paracidovorax valerianellae]
MKKLILTALIAAAAQCASADGLQSLESFMKGAAAGRADFTQTVTSPPKDGETARTKTSSGTFEFQRPGRFRFAYKKPFEQTIVADGKTLWLYDADLNQVTQRSQSQALGTTPAALLASAPDLQALRADFTLESVPEQDGLQWVLATPKAKDGQLKSVRVGFRGEQLAALDILDSFGQRSAIRFNNVQSSPSLPASTFEFKPPAGADVVRQ